MVKVPEVIIKTDFAWLWVHTGWGGGCYSLVIKCHILLWVHSAHQLIVNYQILLLADTTHVDGEFFLLACTLWGSNFGFWFSRATGKLTLISHSALCPQYICRQGTIIDEQKQRGKREYVQKERMNKTKTWYSMSIPQLEVRAYSIIGKAKEKRMIKKKVIKLILYILLCVHMGKEKRAHDTERNNLLHKCTKPIEFKLCPFLSCLPSLCFWELACSSNGL